MDMALMMMKLGTAIAGSNFDLTPLEKESDSSGEGSSDSEDSEDSDDESDSSGEGSEDSEDSEDESDSSGEDSDDGSDSSDDGSDSSEDESDSSDDGSDSSEDSGDGSDDGSDNYDSDSESDNSDSEDDGFDNYDSDSEEGSDESSPAGNGASREDGGIDKEALLEALEDAFNGGLLDNAEALREAIWGDYETDAGYNEQEWRPARPDLDRVIKPRGNYDTAMTMREKGALLTGAIMGRFRRKFLEARRPKTFHGVKFGRGLSERRLVDTMVEIKSGIRPTRPEYTTHKGRDVSLALAVVADQSGSMWSRKERCATAMLAFADAFERLGSPVMCCGIRDTRSYSGNSENEDVDLTVPGDDVSDLRYSRGGNDHVIYDVFKDWDESLRHKRVVSRFAAYKAGGGTPLSDGVAFALESISHRPERHRVIIVLTDGRPRNHRTMNYLVRKAREAGIGVVGVGIGSGMEKDIAELYPDHHVAVENLNDLAPEVVKQIESIVFPPVNGGAAALKVKTTG